VSSACGKQLIPDYRIRRHSTRNPRGDGKGHLPASAQTQ
jgi:hypothetical protein